MGDASPSKTGGSIGGMGGATSIGNYKGVMLCNRPFGGTQAVNRAANATKPKTFTAGVVPEPAGINVSLSSKEKHKARRPKKETFLTKHKRWLKDLQRTKDNLEIAYIDEMKRKEDQKNKFQSQERKLRIMSKEVIAESKDAKDDDSASNYSMDSPAPSYQSDSKGGPETNSPLSINTADIKDSSLSESKADSKSDSLTSKLLAKMKNKPAWALTEEKSAAKEDEDELDLDMLSDDEGLLDFAQKLDYDKFINDMEVKSMITALKERIGLLEKDAKNEDLREAELEELREERENLKLLEEMEAASQDKKHHGDDNLYSAAEDIMEQDEGISKVHSKTSVTSLLQKAKDKIASITEGHEINNMAPPSVTVTGEPPIVVHEPSEGQRINGKQTVSNLPYQHRNPAV